MAVTEEVKMPQAGESDGTIVKWLKQVGDSVDRDEPLFEFSTANRTVKAPAPASGVLAQITVQEGQTVPVNTVVAVIAVSVIGGIPGGVPGGVFGGVPGGVPGEIPGGIVGVVTKYGEILGTNGIILSATATVS